MGSKIESQPIHDNSLKETQNHAAKPDLKNLEKERKFIDWLQKIISSPVKERRREILERKKENQDPEKLATIKSELFETKKTIKYISSNDFRKELVHWEPWRLNEKSVETEKNLYIRVAKGYASESFLNWTIEEAEKHSITQNQFLAGIIETVRKTEWGTIKVMASKNIATEYTLPHLVIGNSPSSDVFIFHNTLQKIKKEASKKNIVGLFSEEKAVKRKQIGEDVDATPIALFKLAQMLGQLGYTGSWLTQGVNSENIIGIYDKSLQKLFNDNNNQEKREVINTIVEEEVHHQKYKDRVLKKEKEKINMSEVTFEQVLGSGDKIEKAAGVKKMVAEITHELPPLEKLLEPFYQRIGQKLK
jgi:hypothetical protein